MQLFGAFIKTLWDTICVIWLLTADSYIIHSDISNLSC